MILSVTEGGREVGREEICGGYWGAYAPKNAPLCFLYISAPTKATEMIVLWEDRGDPTVWFVYKMDSDCYTKWTLIATQLLRYLVHQHLEMLFHRQKYRVSQKKRGCEWCRVCSTAQLIINLEFSFLNHLKIGIQMFMPST